MHWASGPWFLQARAPFSDSWRFAHGPSSASGFGPWVSATDYPAREWCPIPCPSCRRCPTRRRFRERQSKPGKTGQPYIAGAGVRSSRTFDSPGGREQENPFDTAAREPGKSESADWIVRTAICVEPREGRLHVFMPPVASTEDYLELIGAVEETASELKLPVVIEGSPPPSDHRLNNLKVTPDPRSHRGSICIRRMIGMSWWTNTTTLYEEARTSRLGS